MAFYGEITHPDSITALGRREGCGRVGFLLQTAGKVWRLLVYQHAYEVTEENAGKGWEIILFCQLFMGVGRRNIRKWYHRTLTFTLLLHWFVGDSWARDANRPDRCEARLPSARSRLLPQPPLGRGAQRPQLGEHQGNCTEVSNEFGGIFKYRTSRKIWHHCGLAKFSYTLWIRIIEGAIGCTSRCRPLRPILYILCSILLIHSTGRLDSNHLSFYLMVFHYMKFHLGSAKNCHIK